MLVADQQLGAPDLDDLIDLRTREAHPLQHRGGLQDPAVKCRKGGRTLRYTPGVRH